MSGAAPPPHLSPEEEEALERRHFSDVLKSMLYYREYAMQRLGRASRSFAAFPERQRKMLPETDRKHRGIAAAVAANAELLESIVAGSLQFAGAKSFEEVVPEPSYRGNPHEMDKVCTTLKQFVRDWSAEGGPERERTYAPMVRPLPRGRRPPLRARLQLAAMAEHFGDEGRERVRVLVPGSGLGRLAWECARAGYTAQGNEWSSYMLFASAYALNSAAGAHHSVVHPYVNNYCNHRSVDDMVRAVRFPDVDTFDLGPTGGSRFSMAAGDFLELYTEPDAWDCIASCYFLDTARNPVTYLEAMYNALKPGGIMVHLGPLLFHFADNRESPSLELCFDEVRQVIVALGFVVLREEWPVRAPYNDSPQSMLHNVYDCVFMVVQKPVTAASRAADCTPP